MNFAPAPVPQAAATYIPGQEPMPMPLDSGGQNVMKGLLPQVIVPAVVLAPNPTQTYAGSFGQVPANGVLNANTPAFQAANVTSFQQSVANGQAQIQGLPLPYPNVGSYIQ